MGVGSTDYSSITENAYLLSRGDRVEASLPHWSLGSMNTSSSSSVLSESFCNTHTCTIHVSYSRMETTRVLLGTKLYLVEKENIKHL